MKSLPLIVSVAATLVAGSALAQSGYTVKMGFGSIDPRATSSDLKGTLPVYNPATQTVVGTVGLSSGVQLEVQPQDTLMFSIERAFGDHWSAELRLGYPPKHDVKLRLKSPVLTGPAPFVAGVGAKLAADDGLVVAGVRQWAPTAFINYKFGDKSNALRPWMGVGINHTTFKSSTNAVGNDLYQDGPVRVKLSDSTGLAFQAGVTYQIDLNWSVQASWMTAAVKHNLSTYTDNSVQKATYRFHPSVFAAVVGYSF